MVFYTLFLFLRSTLLLNRNKHTGEEFFCFLQVCISRNLSLTPALPRDAGTGVHSGARLEGTMPRGDTFRGGGTFGQKKE